MSHHNHAVNHHTYLDEANSKGTVACVKKGNEKVFPEIKSNTGRLTNFYKLMLGSKAPRRCQAMCMSDFLDYVVSKKLSQSTQATPSRRLLSEDPKLDTRRGLLEFGMPRKTKVWGVRRLHSTRLISGKGASLNTRITTGLSNGSVVIPELHRLDKDVMNKRQINYFSRIMENPDFLMNCWQKVVFNESLTTHILTAERLDDIDKNWFENIALKIRSGKFNFKPPTRIFTSKLEKMTKRSQFIFDPRDKVIQEAMRFLLEKIFEPFFRDSSHSFRPGRGCSTALNMTKTEFSDIHWLIEGNLEQLFSSINPNILVSIINEKLEDQAFIDILYKYLKVGSGKEKKTMTSKKIGVIQKGVLYQLLSNIYMHPFDVWVEEALITKITKKKSKKANLEFIKQVKYVRYADSFLIGVSGSRKDCLEIRSEIKKFLKERLNLNFNLERTGITQAVKQSTQFLGYQIHLTPVFEKFTKTNSKKKASRVVLQAPISRKVKQLYEKGFCKKNGEPTRNGKFIHLTLVDLINYFRETEREILNYYSLANNYRRMAIRVHHILKYSCALTIASKMRLRTKKKVFSKYGKNLTIKDGFGETLTTYPIPKF